MIDYKNLAKTAAVDFIHKDVPLNQSITKLAEDNDLNQSQIQRVCELSNKAVHSYCLLKVADKNFSFELADLSKILCNVNNNNDGGLISSFEPEKPAVDLSKISTLFGSPEGIDISKIEHAQEREILTEKVSAAIKEIDSRIVYAAIQKLAEVQDLKTQIDQMKIYGIKPEDIRQTLVASDPVRREEIDSLMKKVSPDIKSGEPSAPAEDAPTILNPKHPVVITVKNIFAQNDSLHNLENSKKWLTLKKCQLEGAQV